MNNYYSQIRWVSTVNQEPKFGGGVATAVKCFQNLKQIKKYGHFLSLDKTNFFRQLQHVFVDIHFLKYQNYIIHSVFNFYLFFALIQPKKIKIIILPHGELLRNSLKKSGRKKQLFLFLLKRLAFFIRNKEIHVIATSSEELDFIDRILPNVKIYKLPDLTSVNMSLSKGANFIESNDLNIVNIARITKGKGIHKFICELIKLSKKSSNQIFRNEMLTLHFFLKREDALAEKKILLSAKKLEEITGIRTKFYFGAGHQEISTIVNSIPNKLPFITSKSESFSYALLEMLAFEYKPIVWFSNELVEVLKKNGHCLSLKYGDLLDKNGAIPREISDFSKVQNFMKETSKTSEKKYELVLNQVFNFESSIQL